MMELAIATGSKWCGFSCTSGRVLYANLEIRSEQFMHRVADIVKKIDIDHLAVEKNLDIANLRGCINDIKQLADALILQCQSNKYDMVILDSMYKIQSGCEKMLKQLLSFVLN